MKTNPVRKINVFDSMSAKFLILNKENIKAIESTFVK